MGVIGAIVPWNFPMPIASWAFAPALAAGNCVVLKPAELTPLTALRLAELALAAGIPEDVFQVVPGRGDVVGERLVDHPDVAKIVFTGSTEVGARVMAGCARRIKPVTLELGGKSANIVFADADLEAAAASAPYAVFDNAGQDCCARSRILVQRCCFDRFMELFETAVRGVVVADPADERSEMGPLISAAHRDRVASYVDGDVAFRGSAPDGPGYWFPPTVLMPSDPTDRVLHEEIFGPVVAVVPFDDEADAVRIANDSAFGLSGSIWTRDLGRALRVSRAVEAGNLSVNSHSSVRYWTPFGGYKSSGLGRELGPDAPLAFTETKNVFIATTVPTARMGAWTRPASTTSSCTAPPGSSGRWWPPTSPSTAPAGRPDRVVRPVAGEAGAHPRGAAAVRAGLAAGRRRRRRPDARSPRWPRPRGWWSRRSGPTPRTACPWWRRARGRARTTRT